MIVINFGAIRVLSEHLVEVGRLNLTHTSSHKFYKPKTFHQEMEAVLLGILIVIGNLCLYWVLFGQRRFQKQLSKKV